MDYFQPLSQKDLERGMYIVQHKATFIRLAWGFGILFLLLIYAWLVIAVVRLVQAPSWLNISQQLKSNGGWAAYRLDNNPVDLEIGQARALAIGNGTYNLVATVNNPNANWLVGYMEYNFVVNGQVLETRKTFLGPSDKHLLLFLGYRDDATIGSVAVETSNVRWQRLNSTMPQVSWNITDLKYQNESTTMVGDRSVKLPAQVTWQAENNSLFNFWEVGWQVALFDNDSIIGVAEINERDFKSLERRPIEATWFYSLPMASRVEVWPLLNILDKNNFKSVESNPSNIDRLKL